MAWGSGKWSLGRALKGLVSQPEITEDTWDELEESLLGADFGPDVTEELLETTRSEIDRIGSTNPADVQGIVRERIEEKLAQFDPTLDLSARPAVMMVVGVNGVGKTTTIGKLAKFVTRAGRSVVIAAADTFRAAAVEQLTTWAERSGVPIVTPDEPGQDPASVAYQAVDKAITEGIDIVIIDTAGRLHTKSGLMDELSKIRRVVEKLTPVSEVLLVLDATTGQNGVLQAEAFLEHAGVTGLVLTKTDGSAKGGFVLRACSPIAATSSALTDRRIFPGTPATSEPGGTTVPSSTTVPAAIRDPSPITAPFKTVAPMPIKQLFSTVAPWTMAPWPTLTSEPITVGNPGSPWITTLSCRLDPDPTLIAARSARTIAPNMMVTPSSMRTSPIRVALGARKTFSPTVGRDDSKGRIGMTPA